MSFEERYFANLLASVNITQNAILRIIYNKYKKFQIIWFIFEKAGIK